MDNSTAKFGCWSKDQQRRDQQLRLTIWFSIEQYAHVGHLTNMRSAELVESQQWVSILKSSTPVQ